MYTYAVRITETANTAIQLFMYAYAVRITETAATVVQLFEHSQVT